MPSHALSATTASPTARRFARYPDFAGYIPAGEDEALSAAKRRADSVGRPLGDAAFSQRFEGFTDRRLMPGKRGLRPKTK